MRIRERSNSKSQTDIDRLLPYISPEQTGRLGWSVDQRSDLYSLGVLFYELLTGKLPFQAQDALGWTYAHLSSAPKPPHLINSEIPEILSRVVMKLLAKSPEERYQTIAALRADLARCRLEWERRGAINPFPLGQSDLPQRLLKHDKLVGRNQAFAVLTRAYLDARRGRPQAVFRFRDPRRWQDRPGQRLSEKRAGNEAKELLPLRQVPADRRRHAL